MRRALVPVIVIGTAAVTFGGAAVPTFEVTRAAEVPTKAGFADFSRIVDAVKPSVIAINAGIVIGDNAGHHRPHTKGSSDFDDPTGGPPEGRHMLMSQGSGFVLSADGYAVTNAHVVEDSDIATVGTADGKTYTAKVVGIDKLSDVALLKIEGGSGFVPATLSDRPPRAGEWVLAVGNPFGLSGTVTAGIVSADKRDVAENYNDDFIQIDAPVNRGNSGGPTFDLDGKVIGINTMIISPTGGSVGIAFAITANTLKAVLPQLQTKGYVTHGWLGVETQPLTEDLAESLNLPSANGAIVGEAEPDGPAAKAGIASGDVVTSVNGASIKDSHDLSKKIAGEQPGAQVQLGVRHHESDQTIEVMLGEIPGEHPPTASLAKPVRAGPSRLGLQLTPARSSRPEDNGVRITGIDPSGSAVTRGVSIGDVIVAVGGQQVSTPEDVEGALRKAQGEGKRLVLLRLRSRATTRFAALPTDPI
jgi:serine protease Do